MEITKKAECRHIQTPSGQAGTGFSNCRTGFSNCRTGFNKAL